MHRSLFALALATTTITPAFAQADVVGSGISPSTAAHSQTRPINFAATAPTSGALVIMMRDATLPTNVVDAATAQALNAAIASAKFEGKEGSSLSLRGIGNYARIVLSGVGEEGDRVGETGGARIVGRDMEEAGRAGDGREVREDAGVLPLRRPADEAADRASGLEIEGRQREPCAFRRSDGRGTAASRRCPRPPARARARRTSCRDRDR